MSEAKIDEFPCIFPASREFRVFRRDPFFIDSKNSETSSHLTLPSSRESTNFRFLRRAIAREEARRSGSRSGITTPQATTCSSTRRLLTEPGSKCQLQDMRLEGVRHVHCAIGAHDHVVAKRLLCRQ